MYNFAREMVVDLGWGVMMLLASLQVANADVNKADRYALPSSKVHMEACQREALRLHPGEIKELNTLPQQTTFWIRYAIQMRGGTEWSVVCDLSNGKIIRDQSLDIDVSR